MGQAHHSPRPATLTRRPSASIANAFSAPQLLILVSSLRIIIFANLLSSCLHHNLCIVLIQLVAPSPRRVARRHELERGGKGERFQLEPSLFLLLPPHLAFHLDGQTSFTMAGSDIEKPASTKRAGPPAHDSSSTWADAAKKAKVSEETATGLAEQKEATPPRNVATTTAHKSDQDANADANVGDDGSPAVHSRAGEVRLHIRSQPT